MHKSMKLSRAKRRNLTRDPNMRAFTNFVTVMLFLVLASMFYLVVSFKPVSKEEHVERINKMNEEVEPFRRNLTECARQVKASNADIEHFLKRIPQSTSQGKCFVACILKRNAIIVKNKIMEKNLLEANRAVYSDDSEVMARLKTAIKECSKVVDGIFEICEYASVFNDCMHMKMEHILDRVTMERRMEALGQMSSNPDEWTEEEDEMLRLKLTKQLVLGDPTYKNLAKVSNQRTCSDVDSSRMALKEGLERRVSQFEDEKNYTIATLLDPRYKMNFFTPEKVPWVRRQFLAEYVRRSADMDSTSNSENESEPPAPLPYSGLQSQEDTHKALWTCYEELASTKQPEIEEPKSPIAIELDRYIADSLLSRDMCPYKWWSKNKFRFPLMSNMAKIFLSAPGSSVYSEQCNSRNESQESLGEDENASNISVLSDSYIQGTEIATPGTSSQDAEIPIPGTSKGCKSSTKKNENEFITYHRFPNDDNVRKIWSCCINR
ncbi:hypothetical protein MSG28_009369, partial [Choristoneura fumiferana]